MRIWPIKGPESCALQKIKRLCKDVTFKYCVFIFLYLLNMKEIGRYMNHFLFSRNSKGWDEVDNKIL